ncbi:MAG: UbiA family prenyltransferase [Methanothrix sp.]|jgi:4-hydroxybenzoate polyprenyltransferase|uniref:UbiA prenyltransferase family protein n=1 Tax=Methanothrix sp. TaxID=90426 RepID=UPI001BD4731E|nr:UbiA family prenyltransferase [Methanothrix sp.]MBK7385391.1 UbiA family prenyltransferase [Methanothrix sp.]
MINRDFASFRAYIELLRPPLAPMDIAMPAASALLAVYAVEGTLPPLVPFFIAVLGAYCAITSSYVYNDCCDIDVDKVGMPSRPLPSARLSRRQAQHWSLFLFLIALSAALYLNPESFVILVLATILAGIYSAWAKRNTPFSWVLVGLSYGLVPLGVWLAMEPAGILKAGAGIHPASLILAAMICITDWGFTNCDAARDVDGDRKEGIPTTPATFGILATAKMVALFWLVGIALSIALGPASDLGWIYQLAAIVTGGWLLLQNWDFVRHPTAKRGEQFFYQSVTYRAWLFAALIIDVLLRATLLSALPQVGWL